MPGGWLLRRPTLTAAFALATVLLAGSSALGQAVRHETGRRLRLFENAWAKQPDPVARRRALDPLKQSVNQFLGGKQLAAAQSLDRARIALETATELAPARRWAECLSVTLKSRLLDAASPALPIVIDEFYPSDVEQPTDVRVTLALVNSAGVKDVSREVVIKQLPTEVSVPLAGLAPGDYTLSYTIFASDAEVAGEQHFSLVEHLQTRLQALQAAVAKLTPEQQNADTQTATMLAELLSSLARGDVLETDYPASRLLAEAEATSTPSPTAFYGPGKSGQFWLRLGSAAREIPVRVFVPVAAAARKPLPLVIALHGAGGSENLFFDGYGAGEIVRQCDERQWLLISPRTSGFGLLPIDELITAVAKIYPVDTSRVNIVGHSMGAMQASAAVMAQPARFAAVAALGGGGVAKASPALAALPYFIAAGSEDFALSSARRLAKSAQAAGGTKVEFREYADVEHLLIVQEALPDVFRFFDAATAGNVTP